MVLLLYRLYENNDTEPVSDYINHDCNPSALRKRERERCTSVCI